MSDPAEAGTDARRPLEVSVIIPTVGRWAVLSATLDYLARQSMPLSAFEVIVVHDGSPTAGERAPSIDPQAREESGGSDERDPSTREDSINQVDSALTVTSVYLPKSGVIAARNAGAERASANILVFLDDDIALAPDALAAMCDAVRQAGDAIVLGALDERPGVDDHVTFDSATTFGSPGECRMADVPFSQCLTGFLGTSRDRFRQLGGFQDPTGGWPSWEDVDFGYRAHVLGIRTVRALDARAVHRDAAQSTFELTRDRWWRASHAAAALFERHPDLSSHVPMYRDKLPIAWREDSRALVARKLARRILSSPPAANLLLGIRRVLIDIHGPRAVVRTIEDWLIRGAMVHGLRAGLRDRARRRA